MMAMSAPMPGVGGDGGTNAYTFNASSFTLPDYGTNLWIAQVGISSGNLVGIVSNSQPDISYEIQSLNLAQMGAGWNSEGFILGSELTNWTPMNMAQGNRTNLIVRIRSWADDGSGLPIWWQMQYFGTTGVDPYGNPAGDGWSNSQKFQNGMNPNVFYTPAAPNGVNVAYDPVTGRATVSWLPAQGQVTGYTVNKSDWTAGVTTNFNLPANATSLTDNLSGDVPDDVWWGGPSVWVWYSVQAQYASANSAWSASVMVEPYAASICLISDRNGTPTLAAFALPPGTTAFRLKRVDFIAVYVHQNHNYDVFYNLPLSSSTNGLYPIPAAWLVVTNDPYGFPEYGWWVQTVDANTNATSSFQELGEVMSNQFPGNSLVPPVFDGRVQLKQNLIFQLRAAAVDASLHFNILPTNTYDNGVIGACGGSYNYPGNYAYAGLYQFADPFALMDYGILDPFLPFEENCLFRNFVFHLADVDVSGWLTTGVVIDYFGDVTLNRPMTYQFQTNWTSFPALLDTNDTRWLFYDCLNNNLDGISLIGLINPDFDHFTMSMPGNIRNLFGLPYLSEYLVYQRYDDHGNALGLVTNVVSAGTTLSFSEEDFYTVAYAQYEDIYPETAQPQFQTVEYDFWNPNPVWNSGSQTWTYPIMPGNPAFAPTNQSQQTYVGVGSQIQIAGYAKLKVANSYYPNVYGYLGQYFDQAYQIDANGNVTTNNTGVLSPYGNFFATEPGPAALVTMPDVDTGERGTCTVNCFSEQVDKNSDGTMDLSFNGPDATSQASPYKIWVNSGHDEPGSNGNLDKDLPVPPNSTNYTLGEITCQRDLENFFRLWICGVPQFPVGQGYAVTMSMSPSSGNPAINIYYSCETNGGIGYLTNANIAATQTGSGYYDNALCTISNSQSYTLQMDGYGNLLYTHFLFEGAGIGEGQLVMTISQNGNTIAQTGVWLDLHDVKDFYERTVITNDISGPTVDWDSGVETVMNPLLPDTGDQDLIVLVHGIDVDDGDWRNESDTVFKRLYWAGYHGKFAAVKWPCNFFNLSLFQTRTSVFNESEIKAYKANMGLADYLTQLRSRFPGYRLHLLVHSQGNAVVGEAIRLGGVTFDTYILTQGAMPASAYDVDAPTDSTLLGWESLPGYETPEWQPMGYHGIYTNFPGRIVNFYNTNDPVLRVWMIDQGAGKPNAYTEHLLELQVPPYVTVSPYYSYDGTHGWYNTLLGIGSYMVIDPHESRAMISRSRTESIGRSGPETGHGVIQSGIDLNARFGFNKAFPDDHSAQWTWPIQTSWGYYDEVLSSCLIPTIQR